MKFVNVAINTLKQLQKDLRIAMVRQEYTHLAAYYKRLKLVEYMVYNQHMSAFQHDIMRKLSELDRFSPNEQYMIYKMFERVQDILGELEESSQSPLSE